MAENLKETVKPVEGINQCPELVGDSPKPSSLSYPEIMKVCGSEKVSGQLKTQQPTDQQAAPVKPDSIGAKEQFTKQDNQPVVDTLSKPKDGTSTQVDPTAEAKPPDKLAEKQGSDPSAAGPLAPEIAKSAPNTKLGSFSGTSEEDHFNRTIGDYSFYSTVQPTKGR
jgi:hypothetical protein